MALNPTHVVSDTHFHHVKIVLYEPMRLAWGEDAEKMTRALVARWNEEIGPDDVVLHLGDFAMGLPTRWAPLRRELNGRLILVRGNHDRDPALVVGPGDKLYEESYDFRLPDGRSVRCRHDPAHFLPEDAERFDLLFHGHTHSRPGFHADPRVRERLRRFCVEALPGPIPAPFPLTLVS